MLPLMLARLWMRVVRRRRERELGDEVRAHLDLLAEEYERRGLSVSAAREAARREFGALEPMRERYRDQLAVPIVDTVARDVRYGVRTLRRSPGFALAAIASIALGIGVNCAVFTVLDAALFQELRVSDPDQLAALNVFRRQGRHDFSYPAFRDIAHRQQAVSGLAASGGVRLRQVRLEGAGGDEIDNVDGAFVSSNYFSLLGVAAARGRVFGGDGEDAVVVLSDGFWRRQFGGDPAIIGRTLILNGTPFTIIGVAPRGFFGDSIGQMRDLWIPMLMQPRIETRNALESRTSTWFRTFARLKPGVSAAQASAALTALYQQVKAEEIASGAGNLITRDVPTDFRVDVLAGSANLNRIGPLLRQPLTVLMAVVAIVLLIACCNVANLLLARGTARRREIAVRLAIGCGRGRLIAQLLIESLVLAGIGGVAGLLLASWAAGLIASRIGPGVFDLTLNTHVLLFAAGVTLITGIVFGLVPALQTTALDPGATLQTTSNRQSASPSRRRVSRALIALQVGLSLWLLIGAGLVIRSLWNLRSVDAGIDRTRVLSVAIQPPLSGIPASAVPDLRRRVIERLAQVPGVSAAAFSAYGLFSGSALSAPARVPGSSINPERDGEVRQNYITTDYFRAVGMTMLRGRAFVDADAAAGAPRVAIINLTMARHYFGEADPVGRLIYFPETDAQNRYIPFPAVLPRAQGREIVGVVADAKYDNLRDASPRMTYLPMPPDSSLGNLHLRTSSDPAMVAGVIPGIVRDIDSGLRVRSVKTLDAELERTFGQERLITQSLGFFGVLALLLACVGLYGVMSFAVAARTTEIGLRMALGATRAEMMRMVLRDTMTLVAIGATLGIAAAMLSTQLLQKLLFGVTPTDPMTIGATTLLMFIVAALAGALPARHAAGVDPLIALRYE